VLIWRGFGCFRLLAQIRFVIVRAGGRSSIPEVVVIDRAVSAYWMPRLKRGMTVESHISTFPRRHAPELC
jgi:hypothetical protein